MNVYSRGVRNAFRNMIRTFSIVVILGLSMGLALSMLIANQAVGQKINSVKTSIGNTVSISPAGARGFDGGGDPLTVDQLTKVKNLAHVTSIDESLNDRLTTTDTNLVSAVDAGAIGRRFAANSGQGFNFTPPPDSGTRRATATDSQGTITRTFTPPVTIVGTTNPTGLSATQGGGTFKLTDGNLFNPSLDDSQAVIGTTLATKNSLKTGSTFTAYGATVTVAGIFDAGNAFANNQVIMSLSSLQKLSAQPGVVSSATVNVDSISNIDSVTASAKSVLGAAADVTNSADQAKTAIAPLENIKSISLYSLVGAVIAGAVIILLTMIMIVRERRREIGVIKAIGASNIKVMTQFIVEAMTLTIIASVIGIGIGAVASNPITKLLVNNSTSSTSSTSTITAGGPGQGGGGFRTGGRGLGVIRNNLTNIHATVGWSIIGYGLGAALVIAIVGSTIASLLISKVRPAEVMRAE